MNVAFEAEPLTAQQVWFDPRTGDLHALISGIDHALRLASIPDDDFESSAPVVGFNIGCGGAGVVCTAGGRSQMSSSSSELHITIAAGPSSACSAGPSSAFAAVFVW